MDKKQALKELEQIHYAEILVEDEFIPLDDGTKIKNKIFDIGDTFGIHIPITTFQPNPNYPKGPLPNHTEDCLTGDMNYDGIINIVDIILIVNEVLGTTFAQSVQWLEENFPELETKKRLSELNKSIHFAK